MVTESEIKRSHTDINFILSQFLKNKKGGDNFMRKKLSHREDWLGASSQYSYKMSV